MKITAERFKEVMEASLEHFTNSQNQEEKECYTFDEWLYWFNDYMEDNS